MKGVLTVFAVSLCGCISSPTIRMRPVEAGAPAPGTSLADVKVNDLRVPGVAASTREAAFGVPMGNISFDPPEAQLIKERLEQELAGLLRERNQTTKKSFTCDMVEFGVNTKATPLYWDVIGRVRITLKVDGKEHGLSGSSTERTYIWPGAGIIKKVVEQSLDEVANGLRPVVEATPKDPSVK